MEDSYSRCPICNEWITSVEMANFTVHLEIEGSGNDVYFTTTNHQFEDVYDTYQDPDVSCRGGHSEQEMLDYIKEQETTFTVEMLLNVTVEVEEGKITSITVNDEEVQCGTNITHVEDGDGNHLGDCVSDSQAEILRTAERPIVKFSSGRKSVISGLTL